MFDLFGVSRAQIGGREGADGLENGEGDLGIVLDGAAHGVHGGIPHGQQLGADAGDSVLLPGVIRGLEFGVVVNPVVERLPRDARRTRRSAQRVPREHFLDRRELSR